MCKTNIENVTHLLYNLIMNSIGVNIMNKAATINARIEPALKIQAEEILHKVGLSAAEAIRLFYSQVCLQNGLPFDVKIPNKKTLDAIEELESGKGERFKTMKDVWNSIDNA